MLTFLPSPDFIKSAQILDYRRLGKQRVEAMQLLKAVVAIEDYPAQSIPTIVNRVPGNWLFTVDYFLRIIKDIGEQVKNIGPLTAAERTQIAAEIDDIMWQVKPAGLLVLFEAPLEKIAVGDFMVVEQNFGTLVIK